MRARLIRPATRFDLSVDVAEIGTGKRRKVMLHDVRSARVVSDTTRPKRSAN